MRMMVVELPSDAVPPCSTFTVCCDEDLRLPASIARERSCWTAKSSESRWVRYAVAMSRAQSWCSLSILSTSGNAASAFTLASQDLSLSAASRSFPERLGCAFMNAAASATSCGRIDASRTCPSNGSGNSAIGEAMASSASGANPPCVDDPVPPGVAAAAAAAAPAGAGACGGGATGFAPGCATAMGAACGGGAGGAFASSFEEPAQAKIIATTTRSRQGVMAPLCQGTPRPGAPKRMGPRGYTPPELGYRALATRLAADDLSCTQA
jgi:hypothetical protein